MKKDDQLKIMVRESLSHPGFNMAFIIEHSDGSMSIAEPPTFKQHERGMFIEPTIEKGLRTNNLQYFMDELWRVGIRPSIDEGNIGRIGAMAHHLDDMRKIVSSQLKVEL